MTKPNDISDDAWEVANGLLQRHRSPKVSVELQNAIARALEAYALKKVGAEKERCAQIVETEPMRFVGQREDTIRQALAQSIRNRSV